MSCQSAVYQWTEVVTSHMPHLSKPQATVLALWSVGMVLARSCAVTAVSLFLAQGLERKPNTVRQQLVPFRQARLTSVVEGQCNSGGKGNTTDDGGSPPPICAPSHSLRERCPVSLRDSTRRGAL